ncbi:MAG TPA: ABC transporter permease [Pyrinomonadaceae bacterium]|nr:ABC transporter permease [Pyrinomonadaceae bacterium]
MTKLLAVIKREWVQRVRARMFIVTTIMLPAAMGLFGLAPALVLSIDSGNPLRLVVVDGTGKLYSRLKTSLQGNDVGNEPEANVTTRANQIATGRRGDFILEEMYAGDRSEVELKSELDRRLAAKEIDAYLILPSDLLQTSRAKLFRGNTSDLISTRRIRDALDSSIRAQRLFDARVDSKTLNALSRSVDFETTRISNSGSERDAGGGFALVFIVGFVMYITVLLYGQVVLGAIIEEKETRIAEVLFSSVKPFTLMLGKLLGVSLVALTQLAIWGLAFGAFAVYGVSILASRGIPFRVPSVSPLVYVYFGLFFLVGYFVYATMYALLGSIVTTAQEGGQAAMPIIMLLVVSFYLFLPVSRNPDSSLSFWLSMIPFFAPTSMLVRIVTQTPPFWQIGLSLLIGLATAAILTWVASKIYRIGMLMYGKRPSIREVVRWVRA